MFAADVPRRRRTALVVPPPAMAIDQESSESKSGDAAGSASAADGSVAPTSPSSPSTDSDEAVAAAAQLKSEEARKRKGKMLAVDQTLLCAKKVHAPLQPPIEKLMGDAIRAGIAQPHADTLPFTAVKVVTFGDVAIGDELRDVLRGLGSVSPVCVYEKKMSHADRDNEQNRLLISCKEKNKGGKYGDNQHRAIPFARMFSHREMLIVHQADQKQKDNEKGQENNKRKEQKRKRKQKEKAKKENEEQDKPGLDMQAYDQNGQVYHLKCRYLTSNAAYRIIGTQWSDFLRKNNLLVEKKRRKGKKPSWKAKGYESQSSTPSPEPNGDQPEQKIDNVRIELWAFRSRKLKLGCTDQTEGALGLVLLHYREDGAKHVDVGRAGFEEVMEQEGSDHQGAAMPNMGLGVHEMVMVEVGPVDAPAVALPAVVVEAPVDVPEVALPTIAVEAPIDVPEVALPAVVVQAAGPQGEAAALVNTIGFIPSPFEWEAVESLLLLSCPREKRLTADGGGGCCIPATTCCGPPVAHEP